MVDPSEKIQTLRKKNMDIEDLSEVSVQLEDSDAEWEEGDDDDVTKRRRDDERRREAFLDTKGRISCWRN